MNHQVCGWLVISSKKTGLSAFARDDLREPFMRAQKPISSCLFLSFMHISFAPCRLRLTRNQ